MKSYGQLCAVARSLDVVGDRWTLLIVRELLLRDRARFSELERGLPGIAPNLLASRLKELERADVVERDRLATTGSSAGYRLTRRGCELEGVIRELLKWGAATVPDAPADAVFQMHWLALPARHLLRDNSPTGEELTVRFGDVRDGFDVLASHGTVEVGPCDPDSEPLATVRGPGPALVGMIQGAIPRDRRTAVGIVIAGDERAVDRILPTGSP
ncbi:MAG: winged helix-turn-helix transcriptional regulator [Propionibacteriaceae bacterium]